MDDFDRMLDILRTSGPLSPEEATRRVLAAGVRPPAPLPGDPPVVPHQPGRVRHELVEVEAVAVSGGIEVEFFRPDPARSARCGHPEAVLAEPKTADEVVAICRRLLEQEGCVLATRVAPGQAEALSEAFVGTPLRRDRRRRTWLIGTPPPPRFAANPVRVVAAGTSDLPAAEEAELALASTGLAARLVVDVGVAGLQRLLAVRDELAAAPALIVCAGMEGALPSVVAGLVPCPVIGVPTSVGYGVSAGGRAALESMLASCAAGVVVVNIDNGFGAACAVARLLHGRGE